VQRGGHQAWGDCVMILATTALRISEVAGLQVGDVDLPHGLLTVRRQTYPGRGGLVTKETKGRRRRPVPIIEPLRATLERLTVGRPRDARLLVGPRRGVITTATLRDATRWDELVDDLGLAGPRATRRARRALGSPPSGGRRRSAYVAGWVGHLYKFGFAVSGDPTATVAESLGLPRSTAGRWVRMARQAGHLGAAEVGKAGI
jgi:integrase